MLEALLNAPALTIAGAGLLGLMVGSFLNVVILRLPLRMQHEWREQAHEVLELPAPADEAPPGIVRPASRCPNCARALRVHENIPVLSYLLLRGRCAGCGERISVQYPLVELLTGILSAVVIWQLGPTAQGAAMLVITWALIAMSGIDIRTQLLPDQLTLSLLWFGLLLSIAGVFVPPADAILGAAVGYLSLWLVFQAFKLITGKEGMGFGDFKLLAAFGALGGWVILPLIVILSSLVGAILGAIILKVQGADRQTPIPFGPYLAVAGWIALIWGDAIINGYLSFAGLA